MKKDYPTAAERLKELTDQLEAGVREVFTSDRYLAYLKTMSKFHRYSFGNVLLIAMQCPSAFQHEFSVLPYISSFPASLSQKKGGKSKVPRIFSWDLS